MSAEARIAENPGYLSRLAAFCRNHWRSYLVAVFAAIFMTTIGAFDSHRQPPVQRFFFWLILLLGGTFMGSGIMTWARGLEFLDDRRWLQSATLTLLIWAPATVMVWLVLGLMLHAPLTLSELLAQAGPVLVVSAALTAINYLADRSPRSTHAPPPDALAPEPPPFLERLPIRLRGAALYAVEAEDHYLRLHTSQGADLILMRLTDAIAELEGIEGAQTHRSWWVARDGIDDARRFDGKAVLRLKSGPEVPVSRTYVRALRQAGWF